MRAGAIGFSLSILTYLFLSWIGYQLELPNFLRDIPLFEISLITLLMPIVVVITMMATARMTVLWELKDLP